jgi:hypothetical protein
MERNYPENSMALYPKLTGAKRREFSGMIHFITSNNHPSNPQQPIHSLRLAPVSHSWQMDVDSPSFKKTFIW